MNPYFMVGEIGIWGEGIPLDFDEERSRFKRYSMSYHPFQLRRDRELLRVLICFLGEQ